MGFVSILALLGIGAIQWILYMALCHYMVVKDIPTPTMEEMDESIRFVLRHIFRR